VAVVDNLLQKIGKRRLYIKGETTHKAIQVHRIHKIENKHTEQGNKHKKYQNL
jgi:hypothetical protein